tara:strand:+ start:884 stop:1579 length:696 start_codon:yes stop_codon:yes gene_type:complete
MIEQAIYYTILFQSGNCIELEHRLDIKKLKEQLKQFDNDWKPYNPRKHNVNREGLSIISLDGKLSGIPDLDSIGEYNSINKTNIQPKDINKPTPVYKNTLLHEFLKPFEPWLCWSHFIKLKPGGHFPVHIDNVSENILNIDTVRILVPIQNSNWPYCCFLLDKHILEFEYGKCYAINTRIPHLIFNPSSKDNINMILNIKITEESIQQIGKLFPSIASVINKGNIDRYVNN